MLDWERPRTRCLEKHSTDVVIRPWVMFPRKIVRRRPVRSTRADGQASRRPDA